MVRKPDRERHIEWLYVRDLSIDPEVQRTPDPPREKDIAENFDGDAFGVLTISRRANGALVVLDGQTRTGAVKLMGWGDQKVPCHVYDGLTKADEARIFRGLNNTRKPKALDLFRIRVVQGDPVACAINKEVEAAGWRVGLASQDGVLSAVSSLERLYHGFGRNGSDNIEAVRVTLRTVTEAWGFKPLATHSLLIQGIGMVYLRYGHTIDVPVLVNKLSQYAGGPGGLIGDAKGLHDYRGGIIPRCVAEVVVETYNKKRRVGALRSWTDGDSP